MTMYTAQGYNVDPNDEWITIVYPPTVDWYMLYQRPQQLLNQFSKMKNVRGILVSSESFRKLPTPIMKVQEDLYVVKPGASYDHLVKGHKVMWFSYPPHHIYSPGYDAVVFDALDNPVEEFAHWAPELKLAEQKADVISCTADPMYETHKDCGKPVFMCPNGADYDHFKVAQDRSQCPKPADFPLWDEPIVGFYGAIATWVDYELILKIAEKYKVVLVGANQYYDTNISHPNICKLPHKNYEELPNYLAHFDVTMVPFKLSEMIDGCDPIKFYEYLSAGKPVLATRMPELVNKYADVTYFIDHENVHDVVAQALAEDDAQKRFERIAKAQEHTWEARANDAMEQIRRVLKK